jgi:hypothetical protein
MQGGYVSEEMLELHVERLESRLAAAKSDLRLIRDKSQRSWSAAPVALAMVAVFVLTAAAPLPPRVKAPFQVLDSAGKMIFKVTEGGADRGFTVFNADEKTALVASAGPTISSFKAFSPDHKLQAAMGVVAGTSPAFSLRSEGVYSQSIIMEVDDGKPSLRMWNSNGAEIVKVTEGDAGGGALLLRDSKGKDAVLFGVSSKDAGKVVTYPNGLAGGAMVGLYSSMICGKSGC